jgi:hypothetical protein
MTDRSTWKKLERRVAGFFGSTRAPLSGGNGKQTRSDTLHPALFIEAKLRAKSPVHRLFAKVETLAAKERKTPILALQEKYHPGWLLVCRPEDIHLLASCAKACESLPDGDEPPAEKERLR